MTSRREYIIERARNQTDPADPVPFEVTVPRAPSLRDQIKSMVRQEMSAVAQMQGQESFEEANDFELDDELDDLDFRSQYQDQGKFFEMKPHLDQGQPRDDLNGDELQPLSREEADLLARLERRKAATAHQEPPQGTNGQDGPPVPPGPPAPHSGSD